jgi:AcrR family transcriptional regulator
MEAALRVFAERGFHKATIKEIAREAGIKSSALIYWYFEDKDDLLHTVMAEFSPLLQQVIDPNALMDRSPDEVLPLIAKALLDSYDDPALVQLLRVALSESVLNPEASSYFLRDAQKMVFSFFITYLQHQIELGTLRLHDPQSTARSFFGTLVIYILSREIFPHFKPGLPDKEQYVKDVVGIFLDGLRV